MSTVQYTVRSILILSSSNEEFSISPEAHGRHLAPVPMRSTTRPSTSATFRGASTMRFACGIIRDGEVAKAALFFNEVLASEKVEGIGMGSEDQEGGEEGENAR
ncbi:hypothetical protein IMSHALPRED_006056, partial [Imshaugia aleurites]